MYDWLEERKQQARMQRAQQRPTSFVARTMRDRWIDTGFGPDGRLQSDRPTHMLNTSNGPKTVHEGEGMRVGPDGRFAVYTADEMGYMDGRQYAAPYNRRNRFMYECGKDMGHMGGKPYGYMGGKEIGYRRGHEDPDEFLRSIMPAENIGGQTALEDWEKRQIEGSYGYQTGRPLNTDYRQEPSGPSAAPISRQPPQVPAGTTTRTGAINTPPNIIRPLQRGTGESPDAARISGLGMRTTPIESPRGMSGSNAITDRQLQDLGMGGPQKNTPAPITKTGTINTPPPITMGPQEGEDRISPSQMASDAPEIPVVITKKTGDLDQPETIIMPGAEPEPKTTPTPSLEESGRRLAMGRLIQRATTGSEADRVARQQQLDDLKATLATEDAALAQELAQARVSPREARTRLAMAARDRGMAISDAEAASIIADLQSRERAEQTLASQSLAGMGEERARRSQQFAEQKYTDLETQRMANDARVMDEAAFVQKYGEGALSIYNESRRGINQIDEMGRIGTMFTGGRTIGDMKSDSSLRASIAGRLGVDPSDSAVDNEIDTLYGSYLSQNRGTFEGNLEGLLSTYVADDRPVDAALMDADIINNTAAVLRLDPTDPGNMKTIQDEIKRRYDLASQTDVDVFFNNMQRSGVFADMADTPGWESMARQTIRDMVRNGQIVNGELVEGEAITWPWLDPDTYFNYNDWNNKNIAYGPNGELPEGYWDQSVKVGGQDYKDAEGNAITYKQAQDAWNAMGLEREEYMVGDKVDIQTFMEDKFPKQKTSEEETYAADEQSILSGVLENNETLRELADEFSASYSGQVYTDPITGADVTVPAGGFLYTQPDGTKAVGSHEDLKRLIYQFSAQLNNGDMLSAADFSSYWQDGKGYVIDDNGVVQNFTKSFQDKHDLKAENKYRLTDKKADEIVFEGDVAPVEQPPATGDAGVGYTGFGTVTGKGEGTMHSTLIYNSAAYDSVPGDRHTVNLKPELSAWAEKNAGKTMYYDGKVYKIDKSEPVVYDTIYDSVGEYSQPFKVQGIKVVDEKGVEKIVTFGAKGEIMDSRFDAEGREAALKKFIPNFEGEELRNQLASVGYQNVYDDYALFSSMKTQPATEEDKEIATTAIKSAFSSALRSAI